MKIRICHLNMYPISAGILNLTLWSLFARHILPEITFFKWRSGSRPHSNKGWLSSVRRLYFLAVHSVFLLLSKKVLCICKIFPRIICKWNFNILDDRIVDAVTSSGIEFGKRKPMRILERVQAFLPLLTIEIFIFPPS